MPHDISSLFNNPATKDHWIKRAIAYIIDSVILYVISFIIIMIGVMFLIGSVIGGAMAGNPVAGVAGGFAIMFIFILIAIVFTILYWIYFDAKGGTPGKKILKLTPVALQGQMTYSKAAIRNGSKIVGGFIGAVVEGAIGIIFVGLAIEFIIVLLDMYLGITSSDDPRQKYTDNLAGTTVIRTDMQENIDDLRHIPPVTTPTPTTTTPTTPTPTPTSTPTQETEAEETTTLTTPTDMVEEPKPTTVIKEPEMKTETGADESEKLLKSQDEIVKKFSEFFELDEERALALYQAGYKRLEDFKDAIVEDIIMVEKINPTIARTIINKISDLPL